MKNAMEKSEVRLLAALIAGLLNGSVVAASLSDVHVLRDESRCAVEKCARIFEGEMRDGVIHGAVVVAGGGERFGCGCVMGVGGCCAYGADDTLDGD